MKTRTCFLSLDFVSCVLGVASLSEGKMAVAVSGFMPHTIQKDTERTGFGKASQNTEETFYQILSKHSDGLNWVTCPALNSGTDCHCGNMRGVT